MDTTWLSDLIALARTGNFSRAAELRNVTQPAFSRRIRMLEDWVGQPLVDRRTHPVVLTGAGQALLPHAEQIVSGIEEAREAANRAGKQEQETLRFATTQVLSLSFFPTWLRSIASQTALGAVNLVSNSLEACEQSMLEGQTQFLLCHYRHGMPWRLVEESFQSIVIRDDRLIPISALDEKGELLFSMDRDDGDPIPFLAYDRPAGLGRIFRSVFDDTTIRPQLQPVAESHLALLLGLTLQGRGIAWAPESVIRAELEAGLIGEAGSAAWSVDMEIRLFRPRTDLGPTAERFWQFVSEQP